MRPFTVSSTIDVPRERVFDYLCDVANHSEFSDHYLKDFRLERIESRGRGAAARYRIAFPLGGAWGDEVITDVQEPHLIRIEGQMGRLGRIKTEAFYELTQAGNDMTRIRYTFSTVPASATDRLKEALGLRGWLVRQSRKALRRVGHILEDGEPSAGATRVAAG
jgi:uncharacterized protein YndB with AHSA1/START domain